MQQSQHPFQTRILFSFESSNVRVEIETSRLLIHSYKEADFENCIPLYADEKLTKYFDHGKPRSREEIRVLLNERGIRYSSKGEPFGLFSIFDKTDLSFIGQVDLLPTGEPGTLELGCILLREYHNQGFALEACKALVIDYMAELCRRGVECDGVRVHKVIATTHPKNYASIKAIKSIGMVYEKNQSRFGNPRLWYSYVVESGDSSKYVWNAEDYHSNSAVQQNAAMCLLKQITLNGSEQVLDVGCGDGKITAMIASRLDCGSVLGVDNSFEMIRFAQKRFPTDCYPKLQFRYQNAERLEYQKQFDILFSSFALQWVLDQDAFFIGAKNSLKYLGYLILTVPLGISVELERSIENVISSPKWAACFQGFGKIWCFRTKEEYERLLAKHRFHAIKIQSTLQEMIFSSRQSFETYVCQWLSYIQYLPEHLRAPFLKQIIDGYLEFRPIKESGEVVFVFERIDIIAQLASNS